jgi:hypothetical protein
MKEEYVLKNILSNRSTAETHGAGEKQVRHADEKAKAKQRTAFGWRHL